MKKQGSLPAQIVSESLLGQDTRKRGRGQLCSRQDCPAPVGRSRGETPWVGIVRGHLCKPCARSNCVTQFRDIV